MKHHIIILVSVVVLAVLPGLPAPAAASEPAILIRLKPVAEVSQRGVRLKHVADLTGSVAAQHEFPRLHEVDLLAIPDSRGVALLDKSLIDVRLQLHGLRREQYRLLGPDQIIVSLNGAAETPFIPHSKESISLVSATSPQPAKTNPAAAVMPLASDRSISEALNDLAVEAFIQTALEQQFGLKAGDVQSQLLRPFVDDRMLQTEFTERPRLEVLSPAKFPFGRVNLTVRLWDGHQLVSGRTAYVEVRRRQYVLVCRRTIGQSNPISVDDVAEELRFVEGRQDELRVRDAAGQTARRTIRPGEILSVRDLRGTVTQTSEQLVRARDSVRIIAYRKGMKFVVPAAEALQSGREGQMIRVRNLHSNKIVTGRVVGEGEVEVDLQ